MAGSNRSAKSYASPSMRAHHNSNAYERERAWPKPTGGVADKRPAAEQSATRPLDFIKPEADTLTPEFLDMEVVGQIWGEFLICQSFSAGGNNYYIIDQHGGERASAL